MPFGHANLALLKLLREIVETNKGRIPARLTFYVANEGTVSSGISIRYGDCCMYASEVTGQG